MGRLQSITTPLYRAFDKEEYARDFVAGKFRLRALTGYRAIENVARRDDSEGEGHFFDQSNEEWRIEFGGRVYLLCLAEPEVDLIYLRVRFGPWVVRIDEPDLLARDVEAALTARGLGTFNGVHGRSVQYSKGQRILLPDDPMQRVELGLTQKPESFRDECEYRLYTILHVHHERVVDEFLEVNLCQPIDYARVI
jgi:hypothetical protein